MLEPGQETKGKLALQAQQLDAYLGSLVMLFATISADASSSSSSSSSSSFLVGATRSERSLGFGLAASRQTVIIDSQPM